MRYSNEELDALAETDRIQDEEDKVRRISFLCDGIIKLFERVFEDFQRSIDSAALNCRNSDASTALHETSSAIYAMDIAWHVRETMNVSHPPSKYPPPKQT